MNLRIFNEDTLDALRKIGDPVALPVLVWPDDRDYFAAVAARGLNAALTESGQKDAVAAAVEADTQQALDDLRAYVVDPTVAITRARDRFNTFGDEICASLLLAGLPDAYACDWGARVLIAHGGLVWELPRRVRETAMFLMSVFASEQTDGAPPDPPDETKWIKDACAGLRFFHHMVREQVRGGGDAVQKAIGPKNRDPYVPINQEDLLGTLLTFTVTTFGVLDRLGVQWTDDDREAYLLFWDLVGAALGIGTPAVHAAMQAMDPQPPLPNWIRPRTVYSAEQVLDQLHARQWPIVEDTVKAGRPFPWSGLAPGRMLADALLDALTEAMPAPRKTWPSVVMRELAPGVVLARLGLNGSGINSWTTRYIAKRLPYASAARSAALRMMANDITRHAMESFLCAEGPPFVIPGLDLRELTTGRVNPAKLELK
jgi:hypothetical protein